VRRVRNEALTVVGEGAPPGLLPDAARLERARGLTSRFLGAHLREVVLVRLPIDRGAERVWLAVESMQATGSFKVRGALLAVEARLADCDREPRKPDSREPERDPSRPLEIVAASAGNHGIGVACAAKVLGASATIVVPRGAPKTKTDKIAGYGATVIAAQSPGYDDAEAEAIELARSRGVPFLSPYDDLDVLTGNGASLAFEITSALGKVPDRVYCPIGGGGLATGLACGFAHEGQHSPIVWGVQSEASCAFATSLETGVAVTKLPPAVTLAEGLEGGISERGFARARATLAGAVVATEEELAQAMTYAVREIGLTLEGSAAVALAPILGPPSSLVERDVVVVLTGRNVDPDRLARIVC
jgi:threonine dehydratase